jgi:uncharacterized OB-fold protein
MSDADGFRSGIDEGRLLLRRCLACSRAAYPPMPGCPHCGHPEGEVVEATGEGTLYSWTVCHVAFDPAFDGDVPYVVGLVDLPEGARVVARLEIAAAGLVGDAPVRVEFPPGPDGARRLRFVAAMPRGEVST